MLRLSELVGELVANLSEARAISDAYSLRISEQYHSDPFLKSISIPHYTIEEAEMTVPITVVGTLEPQDSSTEIKDEILSITKEKLPRVIFTKVWEYFRENKSEDSVNIEESENEYSEQTKPVNPESISKRLNKSSQIIASKVLNYIRNYISDIDFKTLKLLEIMDLIGNELEIIMEEELKQYAKEYPTIVNDTWIKQSSSLVLPILVNEYRDILEDWHGILVNPITGKMNEYASKDSLMYLKLKIKEQDFDFIVEEDPESGKSKRFLSNA